MTSRTVGLLAAAAGGILLIVLAVVALASWNSGDDPSRIEVVNHRTATGPNITQVVVTIAPGGTTTTAPTTTAATTTAATTTTTTSTTTSTTTTTTTTTTTLPTTPPPPPGKIEVNAAELALGVDKDAGAVTLTNTGGQSVDWSTSTDNALVQAPGHGSLGPGASASLTISVSRTGLIEGEYTGVVQILGGGRAVPVTVTWRVEHAPVVQVVTVDPPRLDDAGTCPSGSKTLTGLVSADVIDESATAQVTMEWVGPGPGGNATLALTGPGKWSAKLGPLTGPGTWTVTVSATDARGNIGTDTTTLEVTACR